MRRDRSRREDHCRYVSDFSHFKREHPRFELEYGIDAGLRGIHDENVERRTSRTAA